MLESEEEDLRRRRRGVKEAEVGAVVASLSEAVAVSTVTVATAVGWLKGESKQKGSDVRGVTERGRCTKSPWYAVNRWWDRKPSTDGKHIKDCCAVLLYR